MADASPVAGDRGSQLLDGPVGGDIPLRMENYRGLAPVTASVATPDARVKRASATVFEARCRFTAAFGGALAGALAILGSLSTRLVRDHAERSTGVPDQIRGDNERRRAHAEAVTGNLVWSGRPRATAGLERKA